MYKVLISIIFIFFISNLKAQSLKNMEIDSNSNLLKPYKIDLIISNYNSKENTFKAGMFVELKDEWKIYWENPGDAGLAPKLNWDNLSNINNINLLFPAPVKFNFFDIKTFGYKDRVVFPVEIKVKDKKKIVKGILKFEAQICNKICIPIEKDFYLEFTSKTKFYNNKNFEIQKFKQTVPVLNKNNFIEKITLKGSDLILDLNKNFLLTEDTLLIIEDKNLKIFPDVKFSLSKNKKLAFINLEKIKDDFFLEDSLKVTFFSKNYNVYEKVKISKNIVDENNLIKIILISFLAGLVLNFMPCVLPVISLKLSKLVLMANNKKIHIRKSIFFQVLGVLCSFLTLSIITSFLKFSGYQVGWGFQFQNQYFLFFLTLLVFLFGFNILGIFEIKLPSFLLFQLNKFSIKNFDDFLSGFLMTLLATPCTAPFVGSAISFALSGDYYDIFLVFQIMSLGLSFPLIVFFLFPNFIKFMPKSGNWLNVFRKSMAILFLLTGIWLFSIFLQNFKNEVQETQSNEKINWIKWDIIKKPNLINDLILKNKIILLDITAEWCITCKYNKLFVFDKNNIFKIFNNEKIVPLQLDWTKKNNEIENFLFSKDRYGIPYNEIYSKKFINGYLLPELLNEKVLIDAINKVK